MPHVPHPRLGARPCGCCDASAREPGQGLEAASPSPGSLPRGLGRWGGLLAPCPVVPAGRLSRLSIALETGSANCAPPGLAHASSGVFCDSLDQEGRALAGLKVLGHPRPPGAGHLGPRASGLLPEGTQVPPGQSPQTPPNPVLQTHSPPGTLPGRPSPHTLSEPHSAGRPPLGPPQECLPRTPLSSDFPTTL